MIKERSCQNNNILMSNVLLLNRYYVAIHIITARRAFCLLYKNSAEVVAKNNGYIENFDFWSWIDYSQQLQAVSNNHYDFIRTPSLSILVPRVIRLLEYDKLQRYEIKFTRKNILARDGYRCQYCGKRFPPPTLTIDHVIPRSLHGKTEWRNVVTACYKCNTKKGGRTPKDAGMKLLKKPDIPRRNPLIDKRLKNPKYKEWETFIGNSFLPVDIDL